MRHFLTVSLTLMLLAGSAHAVVLPDHVQTALDERYDAFVGAPGFTEVDWSVLLEGWDTRARFPNRNPDAFEQSDAGINAVTKALMLLESREPSLPHVRYRITYRLDQAPGFGGYINAYVEVTRFNLGPVRHQDVSDSTPEDIPIAPAEHFGIGPDVSWRFVIGWLQSRSAHVVRASRSVLSPARANTMDCLGTPCLAMKSPQGPTGAWQQTHPPSLQPATYVTQESGVSTAAHISELLYRHASAEQDQIEALPMHAPDPQLTFVISMNVEGQDLNAEGLLHQQLLRDDAISGIWTRRIDAGAGTVKWRQLVEYHPGRN